METWSRFTDDCSGIPDEKILEIIGISEAELKNLHEEEISTEPETVLNMSHHTQSDQTYKQ